MNKEQSQIARKRPLHKPKLINKYALSYAIDKTERKIRKSAMAKNHRPNHPNRFCAF
jgi:hypothetical protein